MTITTKGRDALKSAVADAFQRPALRELYKTEDKELYDIQVRHALREMMFPEHANGDNVFITYFIQSKVPMDEWVDIAIDHYDFQTDAQLIGLASDFEELSEFILANQDIAEINVEVKEDADKFLDRMPDAKHFQKWVETYFESLSPLHVKLIIENDPDILIRVDEALADEGITPPENLNPADYISDITDFRLVRGPEGFAEAYYQETWDDEYPVIMSYLGKPENFVRWLIGGEFEYNIALNPQVIGESAGQSADSDIEAFKAAISEHANWQEIAYMSRYHDGVQERIKQQAAEEGFDGVPILDLLDVTQVDIRPGAEDIITARLAEIIQAEDYAVDYIDESWAVEHAIDSHLDISEYVDIHFNADPAELKKELQAEVIVRQRIDMDAVRERAMASPDFMARLEHVAEAHAIPEHLADTFPYEAYYDRMSEDAIISRIALDIAAARQDIESVETAEITELALEHDAALLLTITPLISEPAEIVAYNHVMSMMDWEELAHEVKFHDDVWQDITDRAREEGFPEGAVQELRIDAHITDAGKESISRKLADFFINSAGAGDFRPLGPADLVTIAMMYTGYSDLVEFEIKSEPSEFEEGTSFEETVRGFLTPEDFNDYVYDEVVYTDAVSIAYREAGFSGTAADMMMYTSDFVIKAKPDAYEKVVKQIAGALEGKMAAADITEGIVTGELADIDFSGMLEVEMDRDDENQQEYINRIFEEVDWDRLADAAAQTEDGRMYVAETLKRMGLPEGAPYHADIDAGYRFETVRRMAVIMSRAGLPLDDVTTERITEHAEEAAAADHLTIDTDQAEIDQYMKENADADAFNEYLEKVKSFFSEDDILDYLTEVSAMKGYVVDMMVDAGYSVETAAGMERQNQYTMAMKPGAYDRMMEAAAEKLLINDVKPEEMTDSNVSAAIPTSNPVDYIEVTLTEEERDAQPYIEIIAENIDWRDVADAAAATSEGAAAVQRDLRLAGLPQDTPHTVEIQEDYEYELIARIAAQMVDSKLPFEKVTSDMITSVAVLSRASEFLSIATEDYEMQEDADDADEYAELADELDMTVLLDEAKRSTTGLGVITEALYSEGFDIEYHNEVRYTVYFNASDTATIKKRVADALKEKDVDCRKLEQSSECQDMLVAIAMDEGAAELMSLNIQSDVEDIMERYAE